MATLTAYWTSLAQAFDDLILATSSAATGSTVTLPLLVNGTSGASAERFNGRFCYVVSGVGASAQRTVQSGGYVPGTGALTVTPTWTAPTSSLIALTGLSPIRPIEMESKTDYRSMVNRALRMIAMPERLSIVTSVATDTYATTAYPWLDRTERILSFEEGGIITGRHPRRCDWRNPKLVLDGVTPVIELDVPFTGTLYVTSLRPQDTLVNGADSVTGLVIETDTAVPDVESVTVIGKMLMLEVLMHRSPGYPNGNWSAMYPAAVRAARQVRYFDRTQQSPEASAIPDEEAA